MKHSMFQSHIINPFTFKILLKNSPYCLPYTSYDFSWANFSMGSTYNLLEIFVVILITWILILYWYCKEKFCLGQSGQWEFKGSSF